MILWATMKEEFYFFVCPLFEHIKNENRCGTDRIVCED